MRRFFSSAVGIGLVGLCACVDTKSSSTDSSASANAIEGNTASVTTEVDSSSASLSPSPSPNAPTRSTPPAATGETRREGNPTARPPQRGDPMPPMAGETNARHGPMTTADTMLRDSASGPRFRINSKGQVTPIKK